jgi:ABC-type multidrug transport system ATPase subunit
MIMWVLTTHSVEAADVLGDRVTIMVRGQLRAIGSSIWLKHKFGSGYQVRTRMTLRLAQQFIDVCHGVQ